MTKTDARTRKLVIRQIEGDCNQKYLSDIILSLRFSSFGIETIKELADFEAHREERTKGIVTERCRDFFYNLKMQIPKILDGDNISVIPHYFVRVVNGVFRDIDSPEIVLRTGMKRKDAYQVLQVACNNIKPGDTVELIRNKLTPKEFMIIEFCTSYIVTKPVFEQKSLLNDYCFVLRKNGLANMEECNKLEYLAEKLVLYAAALMHNKLIVIEPGYLADIKAFIDGDGILCLGAGADIVSKKNGAQYMSSTILQSNLNAYEYMNDGLIDQETKTPIHGRFKEGIWMDIEKYKSSGQWPVSYSFTDDIIIDNGKIDFL